MLGNTINTSGLSPLEVAMGIGAFIGASCGATSALQTAGKADNAVETVFKKTAAVITSGTMGAYLGAMTVPMALIGATIAVIDDASRLIYEEPVWTAVVATAFIALSSNRS